MTGHQLNFKMAPAWGQAKIDQVFARASTSGIGRWEEAHAAADKDFGDPPQQSALAKKMPKRSVKVDWSRRPSYNLGGRGQDFGDGPKIFFTYDPTDTFLSSCLVTKLFTSLYFGMNLFFWRQLFISTASSYKLLPSLLLYLWPFYHLLALNCLFQKLPAPPLEIKWWPPLASSSGLDFSSGQQSDSLWAYQPAKVCWNCQCNRTQTQTFIVRHHLSCDVSDINKS